MRGNVRRIGFQHQRFQRQFGGEHAQLQCALKGQRATKTQLETHGDELLGLLQTAIERMGDATLHRC